MEGLASSWRMPLKTTPLVPGKESAPMNGRIVRRALYRHERDGGITASHTTWRSFVRVYVFHTAMYWANPFLSTVLKTCENRNLFSC